MGMDWDPEGDAERGRDNRKKWLLVIAIVLGIFGFVGKQLYERHERQQREDQLRMLQELQRY